jgi:hypothetical protein
MTRRDLNSTLRRSYAVLGAVLAFALLLKLAPLISGIAGTPFETGAAAVYEYLRDMALVFVTVVAAYLANVFQKRSKFVESLEEEWRNIVKTKSVLYAFCETPYPSTDDYLAASCRISETIDTMRIVYKNMGETDTLIGLYPYAPLHDMRRALMSIDPRKRQAIAPEERALVRDSILQSFHALRETFLEELDLREPDHPLLMSGAHRIKVPGTTDRARRQQTHQIGVAKTMAAATQGAPHGQRTDIDDLLRRLYLEEQTNISVPMQRSGPEEQS